MRTAFPQSSVHTSQVGQVENPRASFYMFRHAFANYIWCDYTTSYIPYSDRSIVVGSIPSVIDSKDALLLPSSDLFVEKLFDNALRGSVNSSTTEGMRLGLRQYLSNSTDVAVVNGRP